MYQRTDVEHDRHSTECPLKYPLLSVSETGRFGFTAITGNANEASHQRLQIHKHSIIHNFLPGTYTGGFINMRFVLEGLPCSLHPDILSLLPSQPGTKGLSHWRKFNIYR